MVKRRPPVSGKGQGAPARRPRRRVIESVLVIIGCVLLGDALIGERGLVAMMRARQEYQALEAALDAAQLEHAELKEQIRLLNDDPATIEDLARRELGLIKPGEKLFTVKDIPSGSAGR